MLATPQNVRPRHRIAGLIMLTLAVFGLLVLLFVSTVVVPKFRQIFDDFQPGGKLPAVTQMILATPRSVYVLCCLAAMAMLVWKESRITSRTRALVINTAVFIIANVLLALIVYAMFLPEIGIVNAQNGLH